MSDGGEIRSGCSYVSWQEFDDHTQDEPGPKDVQKLQHEHEPIEEVEAGERFVEAERVHTRRMYDPVREDKDRTESPVRATYDPHQKPIERGQDCTQCVCCFISATLLLKFYAKIKNKTYLQNESVPFFPLTTFMQIYSKGHNA